MRFYTPLLASVLVAGMVSAQSVNKFEHGYCGNTSYTSRHGVSSGSDGWATYQYSAEHLRGAHQAADAAGTGATVTSLTTMYCVMQDQDRATQEQFKLGVFADDATNPGNPDPAVDPITNLPVPIVETGLLTPPAGGSGAAAWGWTVTFTTPVEGVLPADQNYHMAGFMPANPLWSADGISFHGSWFTAGGSGDNPGTNALNGIGGTIVNTTNSIDITAGNLVGTAGNTHQMRVYGGTFGSTLRLGVDIAAASQRGNNPNYGFGGIYPDFSLRGDGLAFRVENKNFPLALGYILASVELPGTGSMGFNPFGVNPLVPGIGIGQIGDWWLELIGMGTIAIQIPAVLDSAGLFDSIVIPTGQITPGSFGRWSFQHILINLVPTLTVHASNAAGFQSL